MIECEGERGECRSRGVQGNEAEGCVASPAILRAITDAGPPELIELVAGGVHDAVSMSSCYPWTDSQVHRCGTAWSPSSIPA